MSPRPPLRLLTAAFPDRPALETAASRALLERVGPHDLPETFRLARTGRILSLGGADLASPGLAAALGAARERGFAPVRRVGGGRAAVFHEGTLEVAHAAPDADPRAGIHRRFEAEATLVCRALERLGVDARVGEVAGEYCPGRWSVNAAGRHKLAGIGQRVVAGGSHTGTVIVAEGADRVRRVLGPVYSALSLRWDPETVGAVESEAGVGSWAAVRDALLSEYGALYDLVPGSLDEATLALARELAPEHRPPDNVARVGPAL